MERLSADYDHQPCKLFLERKTMAIRKVRVEGDPLLRKKSRNVEKIDDRTKLLLDDMVDTMYEENGIGLAAPQIGVLRRLVVIDINDGKGVYKMINPKIIKQSDELQINLEGCLSVPERSGYVERPKVLTVEYTDEEGNRQEVEADEYFAACVCHELDHLDGVLYIDREVELTEEEIEALNKDKDE